MCTKASIPASHPKPVQIIEKRLSAPTPSRTGGADQEGAPRESEGERGGRRAEEGTGAGISSILTAEFAEVRREI